MKKPLLTAALACLLDTFCANAQQVVVADGITHEAVSHASLYTRENGRFHSVISDEQGRAKVMFTFRRLTVSHLNYERRQISSLSDTIFLQPRFRSTAEVVVTNEEPAWIRQKLRRVVDTKDAHYHPSAPPLAFDYLTQNTGTNRLYRYHLTGLMQLRDAAHDRVAFLPDTSDIVAADSSRLTDVATLRRILYEDFVDELTHSFIRSHRWSENVDFQGRSADEVELAFRSKSHPADDRGRIVIDTARCVILRASRKTGRKTNMQERMSTFLYNMARMMTGYKVTHWTRDYRVVYGERDDGTLFPKEVRYKSFFKNTDSDDDKLEQQFNEQTGGGFTNMEAVLTLRPVANSFERSTIHWEELPPAWYIRLSSDAARQREVELANMPATFTLLGDTD